MAKRIRCTYKNTSTDHFEQIRIVQFYDLDYTYESPSQALKCHRHDIWQIWFFLEGNALVDLNGTLLDGRAGDLFLIRGNDLHGLWTKDSTGCHLFDIKFMINPAFFGKDFPEIGSVRLREKSTTQRIVERILFEVGDRKPGWELMMDLYLIELTVRTLRRVYVEQPAEAAAKPTLDRKIYHHFLVSQVKAFIESNYSRDLNITIMAEQVHLNPKYLSHIFKKVTGASISNYLTGVRLNRAKELLLDSHLSIKEIALEIGYTDTSYFDRVFKKMERVSPCDYRSHLLLEREER